MMTVKMPKGRKLWLVGKLVMPKTALAGLYQYLQRLLKAWDLLEVTKVNGRKNIVTYKLSFGVEKVTITLYYTYECE